MRAVTGFLVALIAMSALTTTLEAAPHDATNLVIIIVRRRSGHNPSDDGAFAAIRRQIALEGYTTHVPCATMHLAPQRDVLLSLGIKPAQLPLVGIFQVRNGRPVELFQSLNLRRDNNPVKRIAAAYLREIGWRAPPPPAAVAPQPRATLAPPDEEPPAPATGSAPVGCTLNTDTAYQDPNNSAVSDLRWHLDFTDNNGQPLPVQVHDAQMMVLDAMGRVMNNPLTGAPEKAFTTGCSNGLLRFQSGAVVSDVQSKMEAPQSAWAVAPPSATVILYAQVYLSNGQQFIVHRRISPLNANAPAVTQPQTQQTPTVGPGFKPPTVGPGFKMPGSNP